MFLGTTVTSRSAPATRAEDPAGTDDNCDMNCDGSIDFGDIDPFVELLTQAPILCL